MTDDKSLFRIDVERIQRASLWVLAADESDARAEAEEGLIDLIEPGEWFDGSEEIEDVNPVASSGGNLVWSGGWDGNWIDPIGPA